MKFLENSKLKVNQALIFHIFYTIRNMSSYSIKPCNLGAEVRGIDLKNEVSNEIIEKIKKDVTKYRLLIFKDQGIVSGQRHVDISKWFGELESTFYKHPRSPHPDVFRVSNNEEEGCTNVGRTGWHIDGSFQEAPFAYSLYHMVSVPKSGDTVFIPLNELLKNLPKERFERWDRLWMVSDRRGKLYHPLVYPHPSTGDLTLCFHLGMTDAFIWDYGSEKQRFTDYRETLEILKEIQQEFVTKQKHLQYSHKWEPGDFIISDNLALGHEASEKTQFPVSEVGLRVLHRTTVKGTVIPAKNGVCHSKGDMC